MKFLFTVLFTLLSVPAFAQTVYVGEPYQVAFSPSLSVPPVGTALVYTVSLDTTVIATGTAIPAPVAGTVTVPMPTPTTAQVGTHTVKVVVKWAVVDATKYVCGTTNTPSITAINCTSEGAMTVPVTVAVRTTPPPPPPPTPTPVPLPPGNVRIVVKTATGALRNLDVRIPASGAGGTIDFRGQRYSIQSVGPLVRTIRVPTPEPVQQ